MKVRTRSRVLAASVLGVTLSALFAASAHALPTKVVWVDCAAADGGDGHARAPFSRITDAVEAERPAAGAAASRRTTIAVRPGVCAAETFPIRLDYPVWVRGSRAGRFDDLGLPVDDQADDTLVVGGVTAPFFLVAADDVHVSSLSLDGRQSNPPPAGPVIGAIQANGVRGLDIWNVRVVRVAVGIVSNGASVHVRGSYFGILQEALVARGGPVGAPADVRFVGNRVTDYATGAVALVPANPAGDELNAVVSGNEFFATFVNTGPSNPFGLRVNAVLGGPPNVHGKLTASVTDNRFLGSHRYAIIVSGGNVLRKSAGVLDTLAYAATIKMDFSGNFLDRANASANAVVITYTNSRATVLPCELNPANTGAACPSVAGGRYWKYLQDSVMDLVHQGELDGAWIDHPAADPVDGRVLDNVLTIDGQTMPHQTFVVLP